jgi:hypothetical protein
VGKKEKKKWIEKEDMPFFKASNVGLLSAAMLAREPRQSRPACHIHFVGASSMHA